MHPVEWAKTHLKLLIREELPHVARWIKSACDGLLPPHNEDSISWGTWRAPGLVDMQPSGLAIYDPANAWGREDEQHTQELLARRSSTLIRLVELDLDNAAGNAHVACAKRGIPKVQAKKSPPQAEVAAKGPPITKGAERGGAADGQVERASKKPYRSQVKLFIAFYLLRHRDATDREICRALDADGGLDLPKGLQSKPQDRLFEQAYLDPGRRNKVEVRISKVRNDLRQAGLLPAR
jgi:hypothetical protein